MTRTFYVTGIDRLDHWVIVTTTQGMINRGHITYCAVDEHDAGRDSREADEMGVYAVVLLTWDDDPIHIRTKNKSYETTKFDFFDKIAELDR